MSVRSAFAHTLLKVLHEVISWPEKTGRATPAGPDLVRLRPCLHRTALSYTVFTGPLNSDQSRNQKSAGVKNLQELVLFVQTGQLKCTLNLARVSTCRSDPCLLDFSLHHNIVRRLMSCTVTSKHRQYGQATTDEHAGEASSQIDANCHRLHMN